MAELAREIWRMRGRKRRRVKEEEKDASFFRGITKDPTSIRNNETKHNFQ